jgi:hypothetical protein
MGHPPDGRLGGPPRDAGTFVEFEPKRRLKLRHRIDFIPGVEPYDNDMHVEFIPAVCTDILHLRGEFSSRT